MCESMEIRYVHYMAHPSYPSVLACGEICAGHMEGDLAGAKDRDRAMKSSARKRKAFPRRVAWAYSQNSNPQIKIDAFLVTMFQKGRFWKGVVHDRLTSGSYFTSERFEGLDEAKMAAYDTMVFAKSCRTKTQPQYGSIDDPD